MSKEVATPKNAALAMAQTLKGKLRKTQAQMPTTNVGAYLRYLQDGSWVFGAENAELLPEDTVAVNPLSIQIGWTCWTNHEREKGKPQQKNECLGEVMVAIGQDVPPKHELPDYGWPWREQIMVEMQVTKGEFKGQAVIYKTSSVGGLRAMNALVDQIMVQLDDDPTRIVPLVSLGGSHYNHKVYGRTYTPEIDIIGWSPLDDLEDVEDDEGDEEPELPLEDDVAEQDVEPYEEPEPEPEPAPTTRRRRRTAA